MIQELRRIVDSPRGAFDLARLMPNRPFSLGGEDDLEIPVRRFSTPIPTASIVSLKRPVPRPRSRAPGDVPILDTLLVVPDFRTRARHHP